MSRSPRIHLITNGVVAQYIHEISVRHRSRDPEAGTDLGARPRAGSALSARPRKPLKLLESGLATAVRPG
jgi:hypothetical protein